MRVIIILAMAILGPWVLAQEKVVLTDKMIAEMVINGNPLIKSETKKVKSFEEKTGSLARSFVPKTSLQAGQESFRYVTDEFESGPYYKMEMDINLYNGGRDRLGEKTNELSLNMANSKREMTIYSQIEEARKIYWRALYLKSIIRQLEEGRGWILTNKKSALKRISSGIATNSDKFEFEIKSVEINEDIERAKLALKKHLQHLKILIGLRDEDSVQLGQDLFHDHDWRSLVNHSEEEHSYLTEPDKLGIKIEQLNAMSAGRQWLPRVNGYAYFLQNNLRQDFDRIKAADRQQTVFGIKATWTFSDFVEGGAQKRSANALAESKRFRLLYKEREVENELHIEMEELELLDKLVHQAEENIQRSKKFFNLVTKEYKRGVKSSGDMLLATEKLMNSHIRKMTIIKDFQIAKAHLMTKLKR